MLAPLNVPKYEKTKSGNKKERKIRHSNIDHAELI